MSHVVDVRDWHNNKLTYLVSYLLTYYINRISNSSLFLYNFTIC